MKKIIVSMFIVLGAATFAAPAFADDTVYCLAIDKCPTPEPVSCAIDSDGHKHCSTEEPIVVDTTEEPTPIEAPVEAPIDAPDCSVDMSACARGEIMYDKMVGAPTAVNAEVHEEHKTWWDIFTDPSHIAAEIAWNILENVVVIGLLYKFVFKRFLLPRLSRKIHEDIDKEHGITHEDLR